MEQAHRLVARGYGVEGFLLFIVERYDVDTFGRVEFLESAFLFVVHDEDFFLDERVDGRRRQLVVVGELFLFHFRRAKAAELQELHESEELFLAVAFSFEGVEKEFELCLVAIFFAKSQEGSASRCVALL